MRTTCLFLLLLAGHFDSLQAQTFSRTYDVDQRFDHGWALAISQYGILVATGSICMDDNKACVNLRLLDVTTGDIIWQHNLNPYQKYFHSSGTQGLFMADDTSFVLAGETVSTAGQGIVFFLFKGSILTGDTIWYREYSNNYRRVVGGARVYDEGYTIYGQYLELEDSTRQTMVLWMDKNGNEKFGKQYGQWGWAPFSMDMDANGGLVLLRWERTQPQSDYLYVKLERLTREGELIFSKITDTTTYLGYTTGSVIGLRNGDYAIGYASDWSEPLGSQLQNYPVYVDRYDSLGQLLWRWQRIEPLGVERRIQSIVEMPNGDIVGVGYRWETFGNHIGRAWMFRLNPHGVLRWERYFGREDLPDFDFVLSKVGYTPDGYIVASGAADTTGVYPNSVDVFVVRVDSMGCFKPGCGGFLDAAVVENMTEKSFRIVENPGWSSVLSVQFAAPSLKGRLAVYATSGQQVLEIPIQEGLNNISCSVDMLPPGVYWVAWHVPGQVVITLPWVKME